MSQDINSIERLAQNVGHADPAAAQELRKRLLPGLQALVQSTLRHGPGRLPLARHVVDEWRRLTAQGGNVSSAALAERIAANLCERLVTRLQQQPTFGPRNADTVLAGATQLA